MMLSEEYLRGPLKGAGTRVNYFLFIFTSLLAHPARNVSLASLLQATESDICSG